MWKEHEPNINHSFIIAAYLPSLQPFSNPVMKQLLLVKKVQTGSTHRPLGIQNILRCFYNSPSIPSDSFFQDPTLKPPTRIMLLKTQYQKVWLFSWFSHGGLPVPLDQYNLLKTFFFHSFTAAESDSKGAHLFQLHHQESSAFPHSCWAFCPPAEAGIASCTPLAQKLCKENDRSKNLLHDHFYTGCSSNVNSPFLTPCRALICSFNKMHCKTWEYNFPMERKQKSHQIN